MASFFLWRGVPLCLTKANQGVDPRRSIDASPRHENQQIQYRGNLEWRLAGLWKASDGEGVRREGVP